LNTVGHLNFLTTGIPIGIKSTTVPLGNFMTSKQIGKLNSFTIG